LTFIAPSLTEPASYAEPAAADRGPGRAVVLAFTFFCFFPYPAAAIGNNTGLQVSEMIALASVPFLLARPPSRAFYAFLILNVPRAVSSFVAVANNSTPEAEIIPKELLSGSLAACPLLLTPWVARRGIFPAVLVAVAAAVIPHVLLGLYQVYSFSNEEFPLLFLFRNPSFKSMESWASDFALYIKRPFGLFPEPSAMSASLGPWLVVLTGASADPRFGLGRGARRFCGASVLAGVVLLALSKSGLTPFVLVALTAVGFNRVREWAGSSGPRALASGLVVSAAAAGGLTYVVSSLSTNFEARVESSWGLRSMSIVAGLTANTEPLDMIFGVGPGQSTAVVRKLLSHVPLEKGQEDMAVWSLAVSYYMESGLLGAVSLLAVSAVTLRAVLRSSARLIGFASLGVWAAGVTVTTSYPHLAAIWLFLGVLLEWDRVFAAAQAEGRSR
jgi:hypothetical protein